MVKTLITTIQVNFVPIDQVAPKFTRIVVIKIFTINLPSQPFLGRHLGFHHSLFEDRTLFLQLGCFGLDRYNYIYPYKYCKTQVARGNFCFYEIHSLFCSIDTCVICVSGCHNIQYMLSFSYQAV